MHGNLPLTLQVLIKRNGVGSCRVHTIPHNAHTLTHTHLLTHTYSHTLTHTHLLTHTYSHTLTHTHLLTHTYSHMLRHTLTHTQSHIHSLTLPHGMRRVPFGSLWPAAPTSGSFAAGPPPVSEVAQSARAISAVTMWSSHVVCNESCLTL